MLLAPKLPGFGRAWVRRRCIGWISHWFCDPGMVEVNYKSKSSQQNPSPTKLDAFSLSIWEMTKKHSAARDGVDLFVDWAGRALGATVVGGARPTTHQRLSFWMANHPILKVQSCWPMPILQTSPVLDPKVTEMVKKYPLDTIVVRCPGLTCGCMPVSSLLEEKVNDDGNKIYAAMTFEMPGAINVKASNFTVVVKKCKNQLSWGPNC